MCTDGGGRPLPGEGGGGVGRVQFSGEHQQGSRVPVSSKSSENSGTDNAFQHTGTEEEATMDRGPGSKSSAFPDNLPPKSHYERKSHNIKNIIELKGVKVFEQISSVKFTQGLIEKKIVRQELQKK